MPPRRRRSADRRAARRRARARAPLSRPAPRPRSPARAPRCRPPPAERTGANPAPGPPARADARERAQGENHGQRRYLLDRAEQLVAVYERRYRLRQRRESGPAPAQPGVPREQPPRSSRAREHERVERLKGPDQRQRQQERAAAEQRVRSGRVAGVAGSQRPLQASTSSPAAAQSSNSTAG